MGGIVKYFKEKVSFKEYFREIENSILKRNSKVSVTFYYTSSFKKKTRNLSSHVRKDLLVLHLSVKKENSYLR